MAIQEDVNSLKRSVESINKLAISTSASTGKLTSEHKMLSDKLDSVKASADLAIQMCNNLSKQLADLKNGHAS